ncbi:MAG: hypothetical protein HKN06_03605 [Gammaproteobacteria bacterium]|nr:hypothetical protein [Gammaproteobacteria bacterium]
MKTDKIERAGRAPGNGSKWSGWLAVIGVSLALFGYIFLNDSSWISAAVLVAFLALARFWPASRALTRGLSVVVGGVLMALYISSYLTNWVEGPRLLDLLVVPAGLWFVQALQRHDVSRRQPQADTHEISSLQPAEHFEHALDMEMLHSRRYERSFCHVVVKFDKPMELLSASDAALLSSLFNESVRLSDQVHAANQPDEILLLCPETDIKGAMLFVNRLRLSFQELSGCQVRFGWAEFPSEALTTGELRSEARLKLMPDHAAHSNVRQVESAVA